MGGRYTKTIANNRKVVKLIYSYRMMFFGVHTASD